MNQECHDDGVGSAQLGTAAPGASRRAVLAGAGAAAVAMLSGCATYGPEEAGATGPGDTSGDTGPGDTSSDTGSGDTGGDPTPGASASGGGGGPAPLVQTTDVPVGGGKVIEGRRIVVTQPETGSYKAFSAACTHQGCTVADVSNGTINCPCHGSAFKIADGSVAKGPATRALRAINIEVDGTDIKVA